MAKKKHSTTRKKSTSGPQAKAVAGKGQESARKNRKPTKKAPSGKRRIADSWWSRNHLQVILLLVVFAAMSPVVTNDFISMDDEKFITENDIVQEHDWGRAFAGQIYSPHYKPLTKITWIVEHTILGNNPLLYHLNNVLLHLACVLLLFYCVGRIAEFWDKTRDHKIWLAFFVALLFGLNPLRVESVAWAIERKDVLFGAFYLAGLLTYLKYLQKGRQPKYLYFTAGFYLLSLMSKSMGISLIAMTFLMDWAVGRRDWKKMLIEKWPLFMVAFVGLHFYGFLFGPEKKGSGNTIRGLGEGASSPPANVENMPGFYQQILLGNLRAVLLFLHSLVPAKFAIIYPRNFIVGGLGHAVHLSFLITGLLAALPFIWKKYSSILVIGLAWFALSIIPVLMKDGVGTNFTSDRYTYIPSIGLMLILSAIVLRSFPKIAWRGLTVGGLILSILAGVWGVSSFVQSRKWGDSFALYDQAIKNYPENPIALRYRGSSYADTDIQLALADYEQSIKYEPGSYRPYYSRGTLLLDQGRYQQALADFDQVVKWKHNHVEALVNRGNALRNLGRNEEAIQDYNKALRRDRKFVKGLNNRGAAYLNLRDYDSALQDFNRVIAIDPTYAKAYINMAALYINSDIGEYEKAIENYELALQYNPNDHQALHYKGYALMKMGRHQQALNFFNQSIGISPNNGRYYLNRAYLHRTMNKPGKMRQDARQAKTLGVSVPQGLL